MLRKTNVTILVICLFAMSFTGSTSRNNIAPLKIKLLFLGHKSSHHESKKLSGILKEEFLTSGVRITYTDNPDDLNETTLRSYDGLILYANYDSISTAQEKALLQFVKGGKGFIPIHCASYCFRNSPEVIEMIGGQFKTHKWDSFPALIVRPKHPVMQGIEPFYTVDETYVHEKISKNITVLTERVEGKHHEPYTWVRDYGEGRVFYTAYGHDERTFNNRDFMKMLKNGIMWTVANRVTANISDVTKLNPSQRSTRNLLMAHSR